MKKLLLLFVLGLSIALCSKHAVAQEVVLNDGVTTNVQKRIAVLDFNAGVGVSQMDVDGISAIFNTYFEPIDYTLVERAQIDHVIDEQNFQRGSYTPKQMVRLGQILNVPKVVVGDVNIVANQYNLDVRIIDVESGSIIAKDGASWTPQSSYRELMKTLGTRLSNQLSQISNPLVSRLPAAQTPLLQRDSVEVILGYLKVFPYELGIFEEMPTSVINQINSSTLYNYNTWRIPSGVEISLMRANGLVSNNEYLTKENPRGIVILVTDTKNANEIAEIEAKAKLEEQKRIEDQNRFLEAKKKAEEQERQARLEAERSKELVFMNPMGQFSETPNPMGIQPGRSYLSCYNNIIPNGWRLPTISDLDYISSRFPSFATENIVTDLDLEYLGNYAMVTVCTAYLSSSGNWKKEIRAILGYLEDGDTNGPVIDPNGNSETNKRVIKMMFVKSKH